ncbi:hypothetical protein Plhal703r1_c30g0119241 [Plasmopara halstedii]
MWWITQRASAFLASGILFRMSLIIRCCFSTVSAKSFRNLFAASQSAVFSNNKSNVLLKTDFDSKSV